MSNHCSLGSDGSFGYCVGWKKKKKLCRLGVVVVRIRHDPPPREIEEKMVSGCMMSL